MADKLKILLQHILPKQALTTVAGRIASARRPSATPAMIRWFVRRYGVDMTEAANPDIGSYPSFNDFFTRPLRPGARPIASSDFICPVDGAISQLGKIDDGRIIQAKGHHFTTTDLIGGDTDLAARFQHGSFANLYLSPKDYHRLHMPCDGRLVGMTYVPGALFSVNPTTARGVPNLFARNERVVCIFDSPRHERFAMVLVGATIVGSISVAWHGVVNATRTGRLAHWDYRDQDIFLAKGAEMGRFLLGSTVVLLFERDAIDFEESWAPERSVRMGEVMGCSIN